MSVFACILTRDGRIPEKVRTAAEATMRYNAAFAGGELVTHLSPYGVTIGRNDVVAKFLSTKHDQLLFIDDDVTLPANTIERLSDLLSRPDCHVALGCYPGYKRGADGKVRLFVVVLRKDGGPDDCYTTWPRGVVEVDGGGAGCMMIRREVLEKMSYPWFRWTGQYIPQARVVLSMGEDVDFCSRVRGMGYRIWADGDVRCGHLKEVDLRQFVPEEAGE